MYGLGILKGLGVTLRNFGRKPFTVQYPEERPVQSPRFRGQEFTWYVDRCTGCASCAKFCPLGIIRIVTDPDGGDEQEGGSYRVDVFDIDLYGKTSMKLLSALHMGSSFESAEYRREDLVITAEDLKQQDKHPSTWFRPQLERERSDPFHDDPVGSKEAGREPLFWHPSRPEMLPEDADTRGSADGEYK